MTAGKAFFDTNVLVYAYDASEPRKRDIARALLFDRLGAGTGCTSTQALAEFFSVVTTRGEVPLEAQAAAWLVMQLPAEAIVAPGITTLRAAVRRSGGGDISIWDALIVEAAREAGADVLFTEDRRLLAAIENGSAGVRGIDPFATDG
jgi:predicted nucleic acid-binding protein